MKRAGLAIVLACSVIILLGLAILSELSKRIP